ncbi:MAG: hypothetical protein EOO35_00560 [Cyanobacteriota bacterium]|nr:MAG: hypothetical protein EOO35_00560 [Cyanobacteriota bacterium]
MTIFLLRPLLEITRFDLKKLCLIWNLPVYPDVTNQNFTSTRNRIRLQLLPILRFFFNPQIDTILTQFAQINLQEQGYLNYLTTRLIKDLFSKKKILQNKSINFFKDISYKKKRYFYKVQTKQNRVKLREIHFYQGFGKGYFALHFIEKMSAGQRKSNLCQTKTIISKKNNSSFHRVGIVAKPQIQHNCPQDRGDFATIVQSTHVLHKFEFQNQPLFFFPLAIQKKIGKKLIEYFLNKKVNFFHVEQIMRYLKDSQNMV